MYQEAQIVWYMKTFTPFNTMAADDLATQGARESGAMVLIMDVREKK